MRTISDLEAAYQALERTADAYYGEHDLDRPIGGGRLARSGRRGVLAVAAAVVVGATAAGGSYLWTQNSGHEAGGDAVAICLAPPLRPFFGAFGLDVATSDDSGLHLASPGVDSTGRAQVWDIEGGALAVRSYRADPREQTVLASLPLPSGEHAYSVAVDEHSVVVELGPAITDGSKRVNVDKIDLIDRKTGDVTDLLAAAPIPSGYVSALGVGGRWTTLQDGVFYWLADAGYDNAPETLMSYDTASREYKAQPTGQAAVYLSPLGISWDGGSIPVRGLPPVHPPADQVRETAAFDGTSLAWSTYDDPGTLHWSDRSGAARTLTQDLMSNLAVLAVSGPYVFLDRGAGNDTDKVNGDLYVLDTRTGALADAGIASPEQVAAGGGTLVLTQASATSSVRILDTSALTSFSCVPS